MHYQRFRDILILCAGLIGFLWFFLHIGDHWVASTLHIGIDEDSAVEKADSLFRSFGYQSITYPTRIQLTNSGLDIDSLQRKYGSEEFVEELETGTDHKFSLYRLRVNSLNGDAEINENVYRSIDFSEDGKIVEFYVKPEIVNAHTPFNKKLIQYFLDETQGAGMIRNTVDSLLTGLVDYQHNRENDHDKYAEMLSDSKIWRAVNYYVGQSYWGQYEFSNDSLTFDDNNGYKISKAFLTMKEPVLGMLPKLEVELLPAGSLHSMKANYFPSVNRQTPLQDFLDNSLAFFVLAFVVWVLVVFYFRIKSRAIDTRPAFIVAFMSGFMVCLVVLLERLGYLDFESALGDQGIAGLFLMLGLIGAISSVAFFLLTSVSDSLTRQYWPEKLKTWDLVRRGMFNNKPVGWAILHGVSIGGILAGIYVILLDLVPGTYLESVVSLDSTKYLLGPLARLVIDILISLGVIVPIFMIVTNQISAISSQKWFVPVVTGICFMIVFPLNIEVAPFSSGLVFNFILGMTLGVFYLAFDFVTLGLAFFTFLNLILTKQGWLIDGSPDISVFVVFVMLTVVLLGFSVLFILKGNEKDQLPEYVPEYIEEIAKGQRVQQELDIAREVQKAFLPSETPVIPGFDMSAICEPAQETGGDYYDIIELDGQKAAVTIGDVSGKGIQAAFYMTFAKGVIHSLCTIFPSPKTMLFRVNKLFNESATRGTFISMIYGVLDSTKRTFTYIRAGHNPILYKKVDGELKWLQPRGVAIGMTKGETFNLVAEEDTIELEKGDVLVLYTDGITEAQNEAEVFYDEERLLKLIKSEKTNSAEELRNLIIEDVRTFIGNARQYDDMTLVVIKA